MRFAFIAAKKAEHRVTILCRCMRVTRSGFYAWARRGLSARAQRDVRVAHEAARVPCRERRIATVGRVCGRTCRRTAKPSARSACGA